MANKEKRVLTRRKKTNTKTVHKKVTTIKEKKAAGRYNKSQAITQEGMLNAKQERFCQEYIIDLNAVQAYIRAGYKGRGSGASANSHAILTNPKVQARIMELKRERAAKTTVTAERVIKELALIGFSNVSDYCSFKGKSVTIKDSSELTRDQLAVVEQVVETTNQAGIKSIKMKLHSKVNALQMLAKHTKVDDPDANNKVDPNKLANELRKAAQMMEDSMPIDDVETKE